MKTMQLIAELLTILIIEFWLGLYSYQFSVYINSQILWAVFIIPLIVGIEFLADVFFRKKTFNPCSE